MLTYLEAYDRIAVAVQMTGLDLIVDVSQRRTSYNGEADYTIFCGPKTGDKGPLVYKTGMDMDALVVDTIASLRSQAVTKS